MQLTCPHSRPSPPRTLQDSCATFLLNIPARFDFECALYEARLSGRTLTPADFCTMMTKAWKDRYGDALEAMDPMFWVRASPCISKPCACLPGQAAPLLCVCSALTRRWRVRRSAGVKAPLPPHGHRVLQLRLLVRLPVRPGSLRAPGGTR